MTPEQHNKYLGIAHLAYGGLFLLFALGMLAMFSVLIADSPERPGAPPIEAFMFIWIFFGAFYGATLLPAFIAGYALLKRRKWAKVAAMVSGVLAAMSVPLGSAVCVYTFWFLFSEPGKVLYDKPSSALPPAPLVWAQASSVQQQQQQYVPPRTPPDWR
jgi:fructose-specific phosphotransferase system IIC component